MDEKVQLARPTLIMVVGVPGSGKSTFGRYLCGRIADCSYVGKDMFQKPFGGTGIDTVSYETVRIPTTLFFLEYADTQLACGKNPIISATYTINKWRDAQLPGGDSFVDFPRFYREVAERHSAPLVIFRTMPHSAEALRERLAQRDLPRDRWKLEHWDEFLEREPIHGDIDHEHICDIVTTNQPVETCAEQAIAYVQRVLAQH